MWENTVTIAINPEFSKRLIKVIKEQVVPGLRRVEGLEDQYFVDEIVLFNKINPQHSVAQKLHVLRELRLAKINFIQI